MSRSLPLFPLTTALVPGLVLPLHIFEPRYRAMVSELMSESDEDDREFGVIAVRQGMDPHRDGLRALYDVGTTTILRSADQLPDGRYDITTTGSRRFTITSLDTSHALLRAEIDYLEDIESPEDAVLASRVVTDFHAYRRLLSGQVEGMDWGAEGFPDDPTVLSYLVTAATVLPVDERQALLACPTTADRLRLARRTLRREIGIIAALGALPAIDPLIASPSEN